jgi:putative transposase
MGVAAGGCLEYARLFRRVAPEAFFRQLCEKHGYGHRQGIYSASVVMWLMIWQRLQGNRSLAAAVQHLLQSEAGELREVCKRWDEDRVSAATGSYCQARRRLPKVIVREVTERIVAQLRPEMQEGWEGLRRPVFVVDGSSLRLQHTSELVKEFSPGCNQHGENHWPVMRIVVLHDVFSGLALEPKWGPMYGNEAVSEQSLASAALERLPPDAVVLGDGNFGIFAFAWAVDQSRRPMVLRLSGPRAGKLLGGEVREQTCRDVRWQASRWDRAGHPQLPDAAALNGRIVICRNPSRPDEWLYLFTTLDLEPDQIVGIYKLRWRVETDLRSLKRTVALHQLNSKSVDMVEKELLSAVAAYNLVRAVMCLAARRAGLTPRQLSYSFVQNVIEAALPGLDRASSDEEYRRRMDRVLRYAAQGKLPQRSRKRTYPREVWSRGDRFPSRSRRSIDEDARS